MIVPSRVVCDLCKQDIVDSSTRVTVAMPFSQEVQERLRVSVSIAVLMQHGGMPNGVNLHCHVDCIAPLMPMFAEVATEKGRELVEENERMRAAHAGPPSHGQGWEV